MSELVDEELLSAYLDDEATAAERAHVEQCLRDSAAWRQLFDELRALRASIAALPRLQLDEDLSRRVLAEAERRMLSPSQANPIPANPALVNPALLSPALLSPALLSPALVNPASAIPIQTDPAQPHAGHSATIRANGEPHAQRVADRPAASDSSESKSADDSVALDWPQLRLPRGWRPWAWPAAALAAALLIRFFGHESPPTVISHATISESAGANSKAKSKSARLPDAEAPVPPAPSETFIGAAPSAQEPPLVEKRVAKEAAKDSPPADTRDEAGASDFDEKPKRMLNKAAAAPAAAAPGQAATAEADRKTRMGRRAKGASDAAGEIAEDADAEPMSKAKRDKADKLSESQRGRADGEAGGQAGGVDARAREAGGVDGLRRETGGQTGGGASKKSVSRGAATLGDPAGGQFDERTPAEKSADKQPAQDMPLGRQAPAEDGTNLDSLRHAKDGAQNAAEAEFAPSDVSGKPPTAMRPAIENLAADDALPVADRELADQTALGLTQENVLMVKCELQPKAVESGAFNELLARNSIATTPTAAANAPSEQQQSDKRLPSDNAPARKAAGKSQTDVAAPMGLFYCEASPRQIAAALAEMQQRPDEFAAVAVQPAPQSSAQQAFVQYNRASPVPQPAPLSLKGESNVANQAPGGIGGAGSVFGGAGSGFGGMAGKAAADQGVDQNINQVGGAARLGSAANGLTRSEVETIQDAAAPATPAAADLGQKVAGGSAKKPAAGATQAASPGRAAAPIKARAADAPQSLAAPASQQTENFRQQAKMQSRSAPAPGADEPSADAQSAGGPAVDGGMANGRIANGPVLGKPVPGKPVPGEPVAAGAVADAPVAGGEQAAGAEQKIRVVFLLWAAPPNEKGQSLENSQSSENAAAQPAAKAAPAKASLPAEPASPARPK